MRTELRVAYDDRNLYVFVHAFDPHPDSILRTVTRRDGLSASDEIGIFIDSNGDRRTGYEFYVNAAGVKRDGAISGDSNEDLSWDAVWDALAHVDSTGWTAEFRIPLSQLRFSPAAHQFGFLVTRTIARRPENVSWPLYSPSRPGVMSQLGLLTGLEHIGAARTLEVAPYLKAATRGGSGTGGVATGGDLRVGVSSAFTLNATVLPDFGQVEADPSVVNLSIVETFYPEHRPFFLDGAGAFQVGFDCTAVNCYGEGLFYSRRIGRPPQLSTLYGEGSSVPAPIEGAVKLNGRTDGDLTIGALAARTGRVTTIDDKTVEPTTTFALARVQRDFREGQSGVSGVATLVDRSLDSWSSPYLSSRAGVVGATFRHRFLDNEYEVWGSATASRVSGSESAIRLLQENDVHELQRPNSGLPFDSTRSSLEGDQQEMVVGKYGGKVLFEAAFDRQSPGYDSNDLGYLQRADQQTGSLWLGYVTRTPTAFYKSWRWNFNSWNSWNASGTRIEDAVNLNARVNLSNNWWLSAGVTGAHLGGVECDHCARGGPAMRSNEVIVNQLALQGDIRSPVVPNLSASWYVGDGGRTRSSNINPSVDLRLSSQLHANAGIQIANNHDNTQWFGNFLDTAGTHYSFAHLDQRTWAVTVRGSYALTPTLSFEAYAAPFISDGVYKKFRALSLTPLAAAYDDRFVDYDPPGSAVRQFGIRQLHATSVARWEFRPGSTLFVVWTQDRAATDAALTDSWTVSARQLFEIKPRNNLLVKISYWLGR